VTIPPELSALINQLQQELNRTEQEATEALELVRLLLNAAPDNVGLTQLLAILNNIQFFVSIRRREIELVVSQISPANIPDDVIQEAGEDLGTILGTVVEARISVNNIKRRLERMS
jgi:hypothetical protein